MSLHHIKRMSKKADVDRAWLDYYLGRPARRRTTFGMAYRRRPGGLDGPYHYTKGLRKC